jgi:hypothetical protein
MEIQLLTFELEISELISALEFLCSQDDVQTWLCSIGGSGEGQSQAAWRIPVRIQIYIYSVLVLRFISSAGSAAFALLLTVHWNLVCSGVSALANQPKSRLQST